MFKKAQAAMEFLMTYGWAILVVLAAIAALAYFGVLSPDRFLPEKCTFPSGIACLDFTTNTSHVELRVQNSAGFDMTNMVMTLTYETSTGDVVETCTTSGTEMNNGQTATWSCPSTTTYPTGKMKAVITMSYTNAQTTMEHTRAGELIAKI